jgi:signal transduction histidine kinase
MVCCLSRVLSLLALAWLMLGGIAAAETATAKSDTAKIAAAKKDTLAIRTIEATRSQSPGMTPPAEGWVGVTLPDVWSTRWPGFDGVVWYRLHFSVDDPGQPVTALFDHWSLAGATWLNGSLLHRDASLVEPLSRSWNVSRLFTLSAPLLRKGDNELLVRVSGLASLQPGLGSISLGSEEALRPAFARITLLRRDIPMFGLALSAVLGVFFLSVWTMRRSETSYGWFALYALAWVGYVINQVVESPWPFASNDHWARFSMLAFMLACAALCIFLFRFAERRFVRFEAFIWLCFLLTAAFVVFVPEDRLEITRIIASITFMALSYGASIAFLVLTWRSRRIDYIGLNFCNIVIMAIGVHDLGLFMGLIPGTIYAQGLISPLRAICMAMVLAWHFAGSLSRIERFNAELVAKVTAAREELAQMLGEQHQLALAATRMEERAHLSHNLHDGLGGALVSNIALLEHDPGQVNPDRFLAVLKELRDELRLVVEASAGESAEMRSLNDVLAPLRRRYGLLFESCDIYCRWSIENREDHYLESRQSLDLMRFVQEGLTNVFKHSRATHVEISVRYQGQMLCLTIADNGRGFDSLTGAKGTGLASLRARAKRLGGDFSMYSDETGTRLRIEAPYERQAGRTPALSLSQA